MSGSSPFSVAYALVYRAIRTHVSNPTLFLPPMLFPLMSLMAFAGGLSNLRNVPGFDYGPGYTAFQYVFVLLQSAAFSGVFTGFTIARDFEYGFARRLMIAAPQRAGLIAGYAASALMRWSIVAAVLTAISLLAHMKIEGNGVDLIGLFTLGAVLNLCGTLWAAGIALRTRSIQSGPLMQTPVFLLLFLAPVYVPLDLLEGWIQFVARLNPITYVLDAGRGFLAGEATDVLLSFGIATALAVVLSVWAFRGLRRAELAGSS
jgi:ABC-type multidrug transport system permease subunit